jgi:hypothetical protein
MTAKEVITGAKEIVTETVLKEFSIIYYGEGDVKALCNKCGRLDESDIRFSNGFNHADTCPLLFRLDIINSLDTVIARI